MSPLRVVVLAERLGTSAGGTEVYERNLLNAMHEQSMTTDDIEIIPLLAWQRAREFLSPSLRPHCHFLAPEGKLGTALTSGLSIRRLAPDVLHCCFVVPPLLGRMPVVTTVHDLGFVFHREHYPVMLAARLIAALRHAVRRSARLVAVSDSTKSDLLAATKARAERVEVVHNGLDCQFISDHSGGEDRQAILSRHGIRQPYLLYAGKLEPRKNVGTLIKAYDLLREDLRFAGQLVIMGSPRTFMWQEAQRAIDGSPFRSDIIQIGFVADQEVPVIYAHAVALAFISLYEGFGFPVVEAMASAVPVVCSNTTCLPEIAGEAALLVDPFDQGQIARALSLAINDRAVRRRLIEKGLQRTRYFTWHAAAAKMLDIYRDAARTIRHT